MQLSNTLYSGTVKDNLFKFCSQECKALWIPSEAGEGLDSMHVASCLDGTCQSEEEDAPLMTTINQNENGVEQIYLCADGDKRLYIIWHMRELEQQRFANFYISKDCLPLCSVWVKQICMGESEFVSHLITSKKEEIQVQLLQHFNKSAKACHVENFEAFLMQTLPEFNESGKFEYNICNGLYNFCLWRKELSTIKVYKYYDFKLVDV